MFDARVLADLAGRHKEFFGQLRDVELQLKKRFYEMDSAVDALILAVASGEPLLLVGRPGTAKSRLIRALCDLLGMDGNTRGGGYFEYLLTPFTEPGELFGFYDIARASKDGQIVRIADGMMQGAKVIYLDEVFNGSSAILNSLLTFINERFFHDRGHRVPVALECLFGATNQPPDAPDLRAVFDRFLLRCFVDNVDVQGPDAPERLAALLKKGWAETFGDHHEVRRHPTLLDQGRSFRKDVQELTASGKLMPDLKNPAYQDLVRIVHAVRRDGLSEMSNRRLVKMLNVMLIHCLYEAAAVRKGAPQPPGGSQLRLVARFFLDKSNAEIVGKFDRTLVP